MADANSSTDTEKDKSRVYGRVSFADSEDIIVVLESNNKDEKSPGDVSLKTLCKPCSVKDKITAAEFYCTKCSEYQCLDCSTAHKMIPSASDHQIVVAGYTNEALPGYDMKGLDQCKNHAEILRFYCEDEKKLCCSTCAFLSHKKCHNVVEIQKLISMNQPAFAAVEQDLLNISATASKILQHTKRQRRKLTSDASDVMIKLQKMQEEVNKMFENMKRAVSKEIDIFKKQAFNDFDAKQASCKSTISVVERSLSEIQEIAKKGSLAQQFLAAHQMKDRMMELQEKIEHENRTIKDIIVTFDFANTFELPPTPDRTIGKLSMKYEKPSDAEFGSHPQSEHKLKLSKVAAIDLKQEGSDLHEPLYSGIDFLPDGRLVAVDNKNDKCLLFDQHLKVLGTLNLFCKPQDVVVITKDEVAITTGSECMMEFVRIGPSNEMFALRSCELSMELSSVSVMDEASLLVGTIDDIKPVRVISLQGEEQLLDVSFPAKKYPVRHSACTYLRNCDKVVITDRYENAVFIYDVATNTSIEIRDKKVMMEPRGVAVGPDDTIFVCSSKTNTLIEISREGDILASHKVDMLYTCRVCMSKDNGRVAVTNACVGEKRLQIFEISEIC